MTGEHPDEDLELHPLGLLDDSAARRVEAHVAGCATCADRLADARMVGAALAAALPAVRPTSGLAARLRTAAAPPAQRRSYEWLLAACLASALLGIAWQSIATRDRVARDDAVLATIVGSHFEHTALTPRAGAALRAKVLYARDGSWLYVVVTRPGGTLTATGESAAGAVALGTLAGDDAAATLFVRPAVRVTGLRLVRDGVAVATARLVTPAP